jgi:LCP family protein required for cell wall assembly
MLGAIDTETLECNIINIPRDSMIDTTAKIKRINGAYGRAGIDGLCTAVQEVTGVYPQYYCVLNMKSFIKVVDVIGGVYYNVPMRMYHPDAQSEFTIDLYPGWQTLDGDHALQMVRFRGTSASDFGRIELQRKFLIATLKQVREKFTITKATSIIETIAKSIKTNMTAHDMVWFYTNVVTKLDLDKNVKFHTLPYTTTGYYAGQAYVFLDRAKIVELVNKTVNPFTTDFEESELKVPNQNGIVYY